MVLKILLNYLILLICVVGFGGGAMTILMLPVPQIVLSCFNYRCSDKWQTVFMLEVHLFISTIMGIYLAGNLYLRYVSGDAESVLVFREMMKAGVILVLSLGIITTVLKFCSIKKKNRMQSIDHSR